MSHLRCEDCAASPALKRERGCGRRPIVRGEQWDAEGHVGWGRVAGQSDGTIALLGEQAYEEADLGHVLREAGWLWPWCPAWFSRKCDHGAASVANRVLRITRARLGEAMDLALDGPLTPAGVDLVEMCSRLSSSLRKEKDDLAGDVAGAPRRRGG